MRLLQLPIPFLSHTVPLRKIYNCCRCFSSALSATMKLAMLMRFLPGEPNSLSIARYVKHPVESLEARHASQQLNIIKHPTDCQCAIAGVIVIARATTLQPKSTASSVFVASDKSVTFAINVPNDGSKDLYFSLSGPSSSSWIAVGMGHTQMSNSLYIMAYASGVGNNVTISPRIATGNSEPAYTSLITITSLNGTGITKGIMTADGICRNCWSWVGGNIDVLSTTQNMIFASGPSGSLSSTSLSANTNRHVSYGSFQMNLVQATGSSGVPATSGVTTSSGATQQTDKSDHDFTPVLHGEYSRWFP
jgi:hypothetical protein